MILEFRDDVYSVIRKLNSVIDMTRIIETLDDNQKKEALKLLQSLTRDAAVDLDVIEKDLALQNPESMLTQQ